MRIAYCPDGARPLVVDGTLILEYHDAQRPLAFRGEQAHCRSVASLGTGVTVILKAAVDAGSTTVTLLIPTVVLRPGKSSTVETVLIATAHDLFLSGIGQPQRDREAVAALTGEPSSRCAVATFAGAGPRQPGQFRAISVDHEMRCATRTDGYGRRGGGPLNLGDRGYRDQQS